jgi:DNA-binding NarL/FixJ family response regulator/class 3 adenylate cyclase
MTELPSGTVTLLFTDIEGSTVLLRQLRERYGEILAEQYGLLQTAIEAEGGHEIGTQGDAVFAVFQKPKDALLAAVAAQRALTDHPWPEEVRLRVRMGIHTGEVTIVADNYVGLALHRVARICAAGHGGQILVSQSTQALVDDAEDELGVTLRDLGPQRLKDFDRPVRIYQLVASGLPASFPSLRTLESDPSDAAVPPIDADGTGIRVVIADDQALVRAGFRMILEAEDGIEVVGEAGDGVEAVTEVERLQPDVVLMDVRMPEMDGIEATRRLLADGASGSKVVMLTTFDMDEYVYDALRAGASGFLLKDTPPEQLVAGIRSVATGDALLAPAVTRRVIEEFVSRPPTAARPVPAGLDDLTAREAEVLTLIARGLSNAEIAETLVVSETTVKTHVAHVLMKLNLRDRVQAVVLAYESGLVQRGES